VYLSSRRRLEEVREQLIEMEKGEEFIETDEKSLEKFIDYNHQQKMKELENLTGRMKEDRNSDNESDKEE